MSPGELSEDLLAILRIVKERGGTDCSGSCHHRKPGEFHCHTLSQLLKISSSGVKERIRNLVNMGLMERHRIEGDNPLVRFTVSPDGEKVLASSDNRR
ncbi:Transcriptional regulator (fragment) [Syntrophobacter sp. SbD1]